MKLNALHLFLILLGSLIFCSILGNPTVEGMSGKSGRPHKDDKLYKIIHMKALSALSSLFLSSLLSSVHMNSLGLLLEFLVNNR